MPAKKKIEPAQWFVEYYVGNIYHSWSLIDKTITWRKEDDPTEDDLMDLFDYAGDDMAFAGIYSFRELDESEED